MPAPLFTTEEIGRLAAVRKHVDHEGRHRRLPNREGKLQIYTLSSDDMPNVAFFVELDRQIPGCHFTLSVKMDDARPEQAIVRYDIQPMAHINPDGSVMQPNLPHRHTYTPQMVSQFGAWDRIAERIFLQSNVCDRLWAKFLTDLNIHFSDTDTQLFSFSSAR
jgi:hypothetical protein